MTAGYPATVLGEEVALPRQGTANAWGDVQEPSQAGLVGQTGNTRQNMWQAYARVLANKGAPGVDGMTVGQLKSFLKRCWPKIKQTLLDQLDKELEQRKLRFVRYADDFVIYVRSKRTAERGQF